MEETFPKEIKIKMHTWPLPTSANLPSPQVTLFDNVTSIHISQCMLNFRILMRSLELAVSDLNHVFLWKEFQVK
jgi:hypothetical protein